jgi:hypothetical protein
MFGHPIQSFVRVSTILKYITVFLSSYEDGEFEVFFNVLFNNAVNCGDDMVSVIGD